MVDTTNTTTQPLTYAQSADVDVNLNDLNARLATLEAAPAPSAAPLTKLTDGVARLLKHIWNEDFTAE